MVDITLEKFGDDKNLYYFPEELNETSFESSKIKNFMRFEVRKRIKRNVSEQGFIDILTNDNSAVGPRQRTKSTNIISFLPMPSSIVVNNSMSWENTQLGVAGSFDPTGSLGKIAGSIKKDFESFGDGKGFSTIDTFKRVKNSLGNATDPVITDLILKTISTVSGLDIKGRTEIAQGRVRNHNLAQLFKGIGFRKFGFTWKLAPKSRKEAQHLSNIIKRFKYYSSPTIPEGGTWFGYPDEWGISFINLKDGNMKENEHIPKIGISVMNSVEVNYTPEGLFAAFEDGHPVILDLNVSFTETEIIGREKIVEGY